MATIVISPFHVASFPEAGGHFWVYMQYASALAALGCDLYWLEQVPDSSNGGEETRLSLFLERMRGFGLDRKTILYKRTEDRACEFINVERQQAESIFKTADLLMNFHYTIDPQLLSFFRRTALVDIDPGLLQFWMSCKQLNPAPHDFYFTTGETVGNDNARFPDCGLRWIHIRPGVFLDLWPFVFDESYDVFTTVSSWWGKEYISDGKDLLYENNKRVTFLEFIDLPRYTNQKLELALSFGDDEKEETERLQEFGWRVTHAFKAANGPHSYKQYIQRSRGEFSCAKPSCMHFQNAWISDRTLCYLASGKPAVVQDTGPSTYLPNGEGLFRFSTMDDAVQAFDTINRNYESHCHAARKIAEEYFDARKSMETILNYSL